MIQRRAACWVLGRYDRLDSVTDVIFSQMEISRAQAI